jgi:hypothetical protein
MVKIGFICEGTTEQILLQSSSFQQLLNTLNLEALPIINAEGSGNLLPHNISGYVERLEQLKAQATIVLTDLDADVCITQTKNRISARPNDIIIVAVKTIESWFLASTTAMRAILRQPAFSFAYPESEFK